MSLADIFGWNRPSGQAAAHRQDVDEQPTAMEYVDWLIKHMLRSSCVDSTIDTTRPLPGADEKDAELAPPCLPSAETVINRLKLLSGLNPVQYAKPVEAVFEKNRSGHTLAVHTRFEDKPGRSVCAIRLRVHARTG